MQRSEGIKGMRVRSRKKDVRKEVTYKGLDCSKRSASKPVQNSREINGTIVAEEVWVASRRVAWTTAFITRPELVFSRLFAPAIFEPFYISLVLNTERLSGNQNANEGQNHKIRDIHPDKYYRKGLEDEFNNKQSFTSKKPTEDVTTLHKNISLWQQHFTMNKVNTDQFHWCSRLNNLPNYL